MGVLSAPGTGLTSAAAVTGEARGSAHHRLWRAITYLTVAQLYLRDNITGQRPLHRADITPAPAGHWGTAPGVG